MKDKLPKNDIYPVLLNTYVNIKEVGEVENIRFLKFGLLNNNTVAIIRRENGDIELIDPRKLNMHCFEGSFTEQER